MVGAAWVGNGQLETQHELKAILNRKGGGKSQDWQIGGRAGTKGHPHNFLLINWFSTLLGDLGIFLRPNCTKSIITILAKRADFGSFIKDVLIEQ